MLSPFARPRFRVCSCGAGKKITSIYGFCDIRQFTDVTEQLNQAVFAYVNDIAEIVHGCSCAYYGMANKNVSNLTTNASF